jgi:RNA polymerase sigma-70 factor (ECF subfamily)
VAAQLDPAVRAQMIALLPRLRRLARSLTGVADQADDLVQAACERALTRIEQWQPGTRLDSWMFRIVQTIWLDDRRAAKVRSGQGQVEAQSDLAEPELTVDGVRRMEAHMTLEGVRAAMAKLPEEQRVVMTLVCVEGQTYKEAAEILSVPIGTVMSRLARARLALARELGQAPGDDGGNVVRLGLNES